MAWIAVDVNLHTHPKTSALCEKLNLDPDTAVGKLARLWAWAMQSENESGEITHLRQEDLAAIMRWNKKPAVLYSALLESGFLEEKDGKVYMHGWDERNGEFLKSKRKDRERHS